MPSVCILWLIMRFSCQFLSSSTARPHMSATSFQLRFHLFSGKSDYASDKGCIILYCYNIDTNKQTSRGIYKTSILFRVPIIEERIQFCIQVILVHYRPRITPAPTTLFTLRPSRASSFGALRTALRGTSRPSRWTRWAEARC